MPCHEKLASVVLAVNGAYEPLDVTLGSKVRMKQCIILHVRYTLFTACYYSQPLSSVFSMSIVKEKEEHFVIVSRTQKLAFSTILIDTFRVSREEVLKLACSIINRT